MKTKTTVLTAIIFAAMSLALRTDDTIYLSK